MERLDVLACSEKSALSRQCLKINTIWAGNARNVEECMLRLYHHACFAHLNLQVVLNIEKSMKFNQIDPVTYEADCSDLTLLKEKLAFKGITVHRDMNGPSDCYEVIINNLGTEKIALANNRGTVYDTMTVEEVADCILRDCLEKQHLHFAFFAADIISFTEMKTKKKVTGYNLRYDTW
jgi:hypothetical protein